LGTPENNTCKLFVRRLWPIAQDCKIVFCLWGGIVFQRDQQLELLCAFQRFGFSFLAQYIEIQQLRLGGSVVDIHLLHVEI